LAMTAQNVMTARQIVLTEADFDRLTSLVESPKYRATHAVLIAALRDELEHAKVVESGKVPRGVVTMHSKVRIRDLAIDETETYTLVYPEEANIDEGKLSVLAPLGTALLGTKQGQIVAFDAPA